MTTHQALVNDLALIWRAVNGYKTYLMCAVWAGTIICAHFGVPVPGTTVDPEGNWITQLLLVGTTACGRSAFAKLIEAVEKAAPILREVLTILAAVQAAQATQNGVRT